MPTALFVCTDVPLVQAVARATSQIQGLKFQTMDRLEPGNIAQLPRDMTFITLHSGAYRTNRDVLDVLECIKAQGQPTATIVVLDDYDPVAMMELLRHGVADCLARPLDLRRFTFLAETLSLRARHSHRLSTMKPATHQEELLDDVVELARRSAQGDANILLIGETGVGKNHLSSFIHQVSTRRTKPFLTVNCAALPDTLVESELFGHRRGAFTGADANQTGKFGLVQDGTLVLDEIDSLPVSAQGKLLRAVDDRKFEPVGAGETVSFKGRLISSTNQDLEYCIEKRQFRRDLFYRLNVVELRIPPLRERRSEIRQLADSFLDAAANRNSREGMHFAEEVFEIFHEYSWPGNVRELRNVVERAVLLSQSEELTVNCLPTRLRSGRSLQVAPGMHSMPQIADNLDHGDRNFRESEFADQYTGESRLENSLPSNGGSSSTLRDVRTAAERARLMQVLKLNGFNRTKSAQELQITRTALYKKLQAHGLLRFGK